MVNEGQMKLRLPNDLKNWIKEQAEKSRRSVNSQVIVCLEDCRDRQAKQEVAA